MWTIGSVPQRTVLAVVLAILCLSCGSVHAAKYVKMVQVMHRHGSRAPLVSYNESLICSDLPCGYLNKEGIQMLVNTGKYLRARYTSDTTVVQSPLFTSDAYNLDLVYTRSTDVLRTLQSAEAFLQGFFPQQDGELYPAVHTVTDAFDLLLNTDSLPWITFLSTYDAAEMHKVCNPRTDEFYPDWTELTRIGETIFSGGHCSDYESRSTCARDLFDIGASLAATGKISQYPLLMENLPKLRNITEVLFEYEYQFNPEDPLMAQQGGRGQLFLQEVVKNFDDAMKGRNTFKLMQYSAHDTTLAPVWGTLGDRNHDQMLPFYAQIFVGELLQDDTDNSYHVRVLRGYPGQTPDTNFEFAGWDDTWALQCTDATGKHYTAVDNTCPAADFARYVASSAPRHGNGYCYVGDKYDAMMSCPTETVSAGTFGGPELTDMCLYYRQRCGPYACPTGSSINGVSFQCVRDGTKKGLGSGAVAGIAIGTFAVGVLAAVGVTIFVCLKCYQKTYKKYEFEDTNQV